jgi:hypothetical protein
MMKMLLHRNVLSLRYLARDEEYSVRQECTC